MNKQLTIAVAAIAVSVITATATFITFQETKKDSLNIGAIMDSVLEITCYEDGFPTINGTGFVIGDGKYVLTNAHLVLNKNRGEHVCYENVIGKNANSVEEYRMALVKSDSDSDLALLRIDGEINLRPLTLKTERPSYGERVIIIGNALGYGLSVKEALVSIPEINIVSDGVSRSCVMISLSIDRGDSGSPIIGDDGKVIGISSFRLKDDGKVIENMSFGITSKTIAEFIHCSV